MTVERHESKRALVLGVGNILLQDEGVGVRVVEELQRRFHIPATVQVLDGGTAGMGLIEDILDKDCLIIVDAVKTGQLPGTIVRLERDAVPAFLQTHLSPHQLGLSDVLATLTIIDKRPKDMVLIGIVPKSIELSLEPSEEINQKIDTLVDRVVAELSNFGFHLSSRQGGQRISPVPNLSNRIAEDRLMTAFTMADDFGIGCPAMDSEHQVQIGLVTAMGQALEQGCDKAVVDGILEQLSSYTNAHCMAEQLLMRLYAYPHYEAHLQEHDRLAEQILDLQRKYQAGEIQMTLAVIHSLADWLLGHIKGTDEAFGSYLNNHDLLAS